MCPWGETMGSGLVAAWSRRATALVVGSAGNRRSGWRRRGPDPGDPPAADDPIRPVAGRDTDAPSSSRVRRRRGRSLQLEEQFVGVAPPPVLPGLEGTDQRVVVVGPPVGGGVSVGGAVAAAHVAAVHAQTEVDPVPTHLEAVLAPLARGCDVVQRVEMRTGVSHGFLRLVL